MFIGIDPGFSGAIAALDPNGLPLWHIPMPLMATSSDSRAFDEAKLFDLVAYHKTSTWILERVGVVPTASRKSVWTFAEGYGGLRTLLIGHRCRWLNPPPATWQKWAFSGQDASLPPKDKALLALRQMFPDLEVKIPKVGKRPHDGIVDAYLIAAYGHAHASGQLATTAQAV